MAEKLTPRDITHALYRIEAIQLSEEPFTLSSGIRTHLYINIGDEVISHPDVKDMVVEAMNQSWDELRDRWNINPDRLVGVPEGMNMLNSSIGDRRKIGQLRIREDVKEHGIQRSIEGDYSPGMIVGINEDIVTTGRSSWHKAIEPLQQVYLEPIALISLVDRQYGSNIIFNVLGVRHKAFTNTTQFAQIFMEDKLLTDEELKLLQREMGQLKLN